MNLGNPTFEDKLELALETDPTIFKTLEGILDKYLKENLSLSVGPDNDWYTSGFKVTLRLKDKVISEGSFTLNPIHIRRIF